MHDVNLVRLHDCKMNISLYEEFLKSGDTLWVCEDEDKLFTSKKVFLFPLVEYIDKFSAYQKRVIILDRIMGNAAALLSVKAGAIKVYSPLGSELASNTLSKYNIEQHLDEVVPFIRARDGENMCPMEKLSISKDMSPDEFYEEVRAKIERG